jgi:hypothetical protein
VGVTGLVDHTHPALTKFFEDAVVRDGSPDHWRECYVWETGKSMKPESRRRVERIVAAKSLLHSKSRDEVNEFYKKSL